VDRGTSVDEHGTSGGNKFCVGTHYLSVWSPSNSNNRSREFVESMKIKLLNSSPYYAQANGQAKASNKVLIKIIEKRIEDNPRRWHEKLSEVLWAHRTSRH
jgi:hypothetical protein